MLHGGEDEGRIWNERFLEMVEYKPQKLGVVGKFVKQKHSKFTFLEISQGSIRISAEEKCREKEFSLALRQFCSLSVT